MTTLINIDASTDTKEETSNQADRGREGQQLLQHEQTLALMEQKAASFSSYSDIHNSFQELGISRGVSELPDSAEEMKMLTNNRGDGKVGSRIAGVGRKLLRINRIVGRHDFRQDVNSNAALLNDRDLGLSLENTNRSYKNNPSPQEQRDDMDMNRQSRIQTKEELLDSGANASSNSCICSYGQGVCCIFFNIIFILTVVFFVERPSFEEPDNLSMMSNQQSSSPSSSNTDAYDDKFNDDLDDWQMVSSDSPTKFPTPILHGDADHGADVVRPPEDVNVFSPSPTSTPTSTAIIKPSDALVPKSATPTKLPTAKPTSSPTLPPTATLYLKSDLMDALKVAIDQHIIVGNDSENYVGVLRGAALERLLLLVHPEVILASQTNTDISHQIHQTYILMVLYYATNTDVRLDAIPEGDDGNIVNDLTDESQLIAVPFDSNGKGWVRDSGWRSAFASPIEYPVDATINEELSSLNNLWQICLPGKVQSSLQGVTCDPLTNVLVDLDLEGNQLVGNLPEVIYDLSNLKQLNLSKNKLAGRFLTSPFFENWSQNMMQLNLSDNQFTGSINDVTNMISMTHLYLSQNLFSGLIPPELSQLTNLELLSLFDNRFTGYIPLELSQLTRLETLLLDENELSGSIPDLLFSKYTEMTDLRFNSNNLDSKIPSSIGKMTKLNILNLQKNDFTGTIPSDLGNLVKLKELYLDENDLSGAMPTELGNLKSNMILLDLSSNGLVGRIPTELGRLTKLSTLFLHRNLLNAPTGSGIPTELGELTQLTSLKLNSNRLRGTIPFNFGLLTLLAQLRLDDNRFSGNIPDELGNLTILKSMRLFENDLEGSMPESVCALTPDNDGSTGVSYLIDLVSDCEIECDCCSSCL